MFLEKKFLFLVCGSERYAYDVSGHPSVDTLDRCAVADIPKRYGRIPKYRFLRGDDKWDLKTADFNELSNKFALCHDEIWEGGKQASTPSPLPTTRTMVWRSRQSELSHLSQPRLTRDTET